MDIGKLSFYSRKIHRWSLWLVVIFGLIQMGTGLILKYSQFVPFIDFAAMHELHFQNATYFSIAFAVQMITGVIMYITPWLLKKFNRTSPPPQKLSN